MALRRRLVDALRRSRERAQRRTISDFTRRQGNLDNVLLRLGGGSVGGKGRGIAFLNALLARSDLPTHGAMQVAIPRTLVVGTDVFDWFIENNPAPSRFDPLVDDRARLRAFLDCALPDQLVEDLEPAWRRLKGPLAVRSSSMLEDQQYQPFSGIYDTYMVANNHPDPGVRFRELCNAIKAVYASTYSHDATTYLQGTPYSPDDEKMAVVIQEVVGQAYGDRFYPHFSGVAMTLNDYPVGGQLPDEGVVVVALGLGETVVRDGTGLRFSPTHPTLVPQMSNPASFLRTGQRRFHAIDLGQRVIDYSSDEPDLTQIHDLAVAEADGVLALVGSVYDAHSDVFREDLRRPGPRAVTFNNILRWRAVPFAQALLDVLALVREGMGGPADVEFAVDMGDYARHGVPARERRPPTLYILQVRPMVRTVNEQCIKVEADPRRALIGRTDRALGHGVFHDVFDVVYVRPEVADTMQTKLIARDIGALCKTLRDEGRPFLLVGPGRWGSSDPHLGVPVNWSDIAGARCIIETPFRNRIVEPSQGTHFFQNITSLGIGYITVSSTRSEESGSFLDHDWLERQGAAVELPHARQLRFERPLRIAINGREGVARIHGPMPDDT